MTVTLKLPPALEAEVRAQAQVRGIPLESYLQEFLASALLRHKEIHEAAMPDAEWERLLRASTFRSEKPLPDEALSRESLYEN